MSDLTLFKGANVPDFLRGETDSITSSLAGNTDGGMRRISIKGGVFREIIGGKEHRVSEERSMNVIIINAAPKVSRTYYAGTYQEGETVAPACWSSDSQRPDPAVKDKQADTCVSCPKNIRGSGQGEGRACRFSQRLAVIIEGEEHVYQLVLPATSIFGDGDKNKMPLQAYARYLKAHEFPIFGVVTQMRFDIDSPTPKLTFKPSRPVTKEEYALVKRLQDAPETKSAITLTVSQTDGVKQREEEFETEKPKGFGKAKLAAPKEEAEEVVEEAPVEEPKKAAKKSAPPANDAALKDLVGDWDD